jgi:hypothetical protein
LWKSSGRMSFHSSDDGIWDVEMMPRCEAKASQIITIYMSRATNDAMAPIDDRTFQVISASG